VLCSRKDDHAITKDNVKVYKDQKEAGTYAENRAKYAQELKNQFLSKAKK
jgi:hypothetical protein